MVPQFLENLTDEELKKEAKNEAKNDALSMIIKSLKNLASRVPGQEETVKNMEIFRLKMILRWEKCIYTHTFWCKFGSFWATALKSFFLLLLFLGKKHLLNSDPEGTLTYDKIAVVLM